MPKTNSGTALKTYRQESLIKGQPAQVECVRIEGQVYAVTSKPLTMVGLEDEWYEDVKDPAAVIDTLRESTGFKADIFTFWQRMPNVEPQFKYHTEWEE